MTVPLIVILLFAVVQSVYGVGILVFGTPTLLIMGYDFPETLSWLLPASITISTIQVISEKSVSKKKIDWIDLACCLVPLTITLIISVKFLSTTFLAVAIGGLLIVAGLMQYSKILRVRLTALIYVYERYFLAAMGAVHGTTNMGGALLSTYASFKFKDKSEIRSVTAFYYLIFAAVQLSVLAVISFSTLSSMLLLAVPTAAAGYFLIGSVIYKALPNPRYLHTHNALIILYGIITIAKAFA
ncbi:hypothetical protein [Erythrobacter donghaensis]|uniref:hypothetical protein n=1 Tax=Erythrobacter donghaensis TaxID=267135 RepID=UPI0012D89C22|nr:hypothetical protein [Erythrobacter donghaensis]